MKTFYTLLLLLLVGSCTSTEPDPGPYSIHGKIKFDDGTVADKAMVYLDDVLKATSNLTGEFTIEDVESGQYKLKVSSSDDSEMFSTTEVDIDVEGSDLDLESLLLPVPVHLLEPTDVTSKSIHLTWNKCKAEDFREYKIYIHYSSALDESTGTLLHVVTDVNDTTLSVNEGDFWWAGSSLTPNTHYFFRVFVMNDFGRMSGSNILDVKTALWDNEDEFTSSYSLELDKSFAAQGNLGGIAWDGNHFWMLYFEEMGGFYDNNRVSLVKFDYDSGENLDTIVFDDSNYFPLGITWDGSLIWISFGGCIQAVDPETGSFGKKYCAGAVTVDLAWDNEHLWLLDVWNKCTSVDPVNGSLGPQFETPLKVLGFSGEKGIAYREGELWTLNVWHNEICILDREGQHIGVAEVDFLKEGLQANGYDMPMCFMGEQLVIAFESTVKIYNVEQKE